MTVWIGLTGGIGCGKSQVAIFFQELGVPVLDADQINRRLISTPNHMALREIERVFGTDFLDENGCLNRAKMRERIFQQAEAKQQLESILHPFIIQDIELAKQNIPNTTPYALIELPTLTEHPIFQQLVERILLVQADESTRIERVMKRSHLKENEVRAIITNQASDAQRLALADDVLHNEGDLTDLRQAVQQQHHFYQNIFSMKTED